MEIHINLSTSLGDHYTQLYRLLEFLYFYDVVSHVLERCPGLGHHYGKWTIKICQNSKFLLNFNIWISLNTILHSLQFRRCKNGIMHSCLSLFTNLNMVLSLGTSWKEKTKILCVKRFHAYQPLFFNLLSFLISIAFL